MLRNEVFIYDAVIIEKAQRVQESFNSCIPHTEQSNLRFAIGWLWRIKKRNLFKGYHSHCESGEIDKNVVMNEFLILRTLLCAFHAHDQFNWDEFALFFRQTPTTIIGPRRICRKKQKKDRITIMACINADGSERIAPLVIGRALNPRCFGGRARWRYGIDYHSSKKAWMTRALFFNWLERFDAYIASTPGRRVLLVLDNCSAHGDIRNLPTLLHVQVLSLPKGTTARLQTLDAGIVASIKKRYRLHQISRAVDLIESGITKSLYDFDMKMASQSIYNIWHKQESDKIQNC